MSWTLDLLHGHAYSQTLKTVGILLATDLNQIFQFGRIQKREPNLLCQIWPKLKRTLNLSISFSVYYDRLKTTLEVSIELASCWTTKSISVYLNLFEHKYCKFEINPFLCLSRKKDDFVIKKIILFRCYFLLLLTCWSWSWFWFWLAWSWSFSWFFWFLSSLVFVSWLG